MKDVPSIKIGPLKYYNTNGVAWYIIIAHAYYACTVFIRIEAAP